MWPILKTALMNWSQHRSTTVGAALAYYSVFSLGPLLLIVIAIAGFAFGEDAVRGTLSTESRDLLGAEGAAIIETMLDGAASREASSFTAALGIGLLLVTALTVVVQLKEAMNTVWDVSQPTGGTVIWYLRTYFMSLLGVMALGFLVIASLVISTTLTALSSWASDIPIDTRFWELLNTGVTVLILSGLFAMLYKWFPDAKVRWSDAWPGAVAAALMFAGGKLAIAWYIGRQGLQSTYGAAASLVILLLWVYFTALIVLLGAEISRAYALSREADGAAPAPTPEKG
ncbi:Inner membrane protein YihY, formerly thought to be RNase BN [Hyphomicrobium sulfonivorans]|uniref:Inner membrane protein YihY, formerly thought to be RNase BN n=1 Tax=Hyphomicrobium sulfonivorans TaxID=121290 RepID=A0A109BAA9_HYPSL|nr:YihY/virulence factor BrkB family protein [Hyphomicrobium sulfonivorans]KWT64547.1 Inner membrane protein YihY, formerly thought to be RNase BN [Hyphomicrobium sulfonivorans]